MPLNAILRSPEHNIIAQCTEAPYTPFCQNSEFYDEKQFAKRNHQVNGDGFGVGFYTEHRHTRKRTSCTFRSVRPAWSDNNLAEISRFATCDLCFVHVRAASPGMPVSESACHPFCFGGRWLFMHNGGISHFKKVKRALIARIRDDIYPFLKSMTDSEVAFGLFLSQFPEELLHESAGLASAELSSARLEVGLRNTVVMITEEQKRAGLSEEQSASSLNFAVTDGTTVVAMRCRTHRRQDPPTLYYCEEMPVAVKTPTKSYRRLVQSSAGEYRCFITSEPLDYDDKKWKLIPKDSVIVATRSSVCIKPMRLPQWDRLGKVNLWQALTPVFPAVEETSTDAPPIFSLAGSDEEDEKEEITFRNDRRQKGAAVRGQREYYAHGQRRHATRASREFVLVAAASMAIGAMISVMISQRNLRESKLK